ncbi:polyhydroxyalkanoate depolymerase [Parapusillimonas granuli]|uniref:Polyhydroxyalkanoate depolymerase n=1 Tax=Parapusillimonas granuli TaxID=380911 RepID=A0A853G5L8_9BURK|nr:polyhydroxyalkanoate depolymerase [Parapusillimonas granuli]MBB5216747.1 poly(3-hydroxybutyrate) depolymerase [Parapusillimonas granuli]MEB2400076.1 polyhydroxyalkanoate depolymerase [Alcaligenaceae bacterium]NYT51609.1 polyhydroxyalkanoate depolymerase [Parapusillimonas granuli]
MLYDLHELKRAFLTPLAAFTSSGSQLFSHPYSPFSYTPVSRQMAATYELVHRLGKDYEKPAWGLESAERDGCAIAIRKEIALSKPFCNLIRFQRDGAAGLEQDPRVLLVAPLSGHHATLLRDTVRALLPHHDVYVTDWLDARMVPLDAGPFHLNDYVRYVQDFLRHLGPQTHVIAVCQPTVPVLAAVSLMASNDDPCQPLSMIMMGGPIDTRQSPTQVNRLATTKSYNWFENNLIHRVPARYPGAGRHVYPGFLQHTGFMAMNPDRHLRSHYDFYMDLLKGSDHDAEAHRRFYDEYNAVLDMPAEFYLDTIKVVFQEHQLPLGSWVIDGRKVDPSAIRRTALLTIEGELDDISGQGQTQAAQTLCSGIPAERKLHYTAMGCGHYGIFSGRRWRNIICPKIAQFIRDMA